MFSPKGSKVKISYERPDWCEDTGINLLSACRVIFHDFLSIVINFFKKILSGTQSECQTLWIQIRTDILQMLSADDISRHAGKKEL